MRGLARHARVRLVETLRSPYALSVVLLSGLATLALSPTLPLVNVAADEPLDRFMLPLIAVQWLWLWPALVTRAVAGRTTGSLWSAVEQPLPQLPVSPRSRVLAEVGVVCALILGVRAIGFALAAFAASVPGLPTAEAAGYAAAFAVQWPLDVVVFAPVVAAWAHPTRVAPLVMLRPLLAALAVYSAGRFGLYANLASAAIVAAVLTAVMVAPWGGDARGLRRLARRLAPQGPLWRRAHASQLTRDLLWQPLARNPAVVFGALFGQGGLLVGQALDMWPPMVFHLGSSVVFGLLLAQVVLRPLGSPMIMASVSGLGRHRLGDFTAAWSVLPVKRHALLRGVYLHGLVGALGLWALMTGVFLCRVWLEGGAAAAHDSRHAAALLLAAVFVTPLLAGLLLALAAGDRGLGILAGAALVAFLPVQIALTRVVEARLDGVPGWATAMALAALLAAVGGLPPLAHLRRVRG